MAVASVIIIFLNAEAYIEQAIKSVEVQTYQDWELILVDDGSTDSSAEIAKKYTTIQPGKVVFLQHPDKQNLGMSASRNLGAAHASGCYIAFLDADDVWYPEKLAEQIEELTRNPSVDAVYGRTIYWKSWPGSGLGSERDIIPDLGVASGKIYQPPSLMYQLHPLGVGTAPSISNIMIRSRAFIRIRGFEEKFRGCYEDQAFLVKLYLSSVVMTSDALWDKYRQHEASCSAQIAREGSYDLMRRNFLLWLKYYLRNSECRHERIEQLTESALARYHKPFRHKVVRIMVITISELKKLLQWLVVSLLSEDYRRSSQWIRIRGLAKWPPVGFIQFGSFSRTKPISELWGGDRGVPIDRYYIEKFIKKNARDIYGCVLEAQDNEYTLRYGGNRVLKSDVLAYAGGNPITTIVADLANAPSIPDGSYDCVLLTQTLQIVYDIHAAIRCVHRILKPGGVALLTVPGITKIARDEDEGWVAQWHFSAESAKRAFASVFGVDSTEVSSHGNIYAAVSFLHGLALSEVKTSQLDYLDRDYPIIITIRVTK